jgi:adenine-specific DNA-methyltransferase
MDEVFGGENFINLICFSKTGGLGSKLLYGIFDFIIWYAKDIEQVKYRQLFIEKEFGGEGASKYNLVELPDGTRRPLSKNEKEDIRLLPTGSRIFRLDNLTSQGNEPFAFEFEGKSYKAGWKTNLPGLRTLAKKNRIVASKNSLGYVRYLDDFAAFPITNHWQIGGIQSRMDAKVYVVQTSNEAIKRCLLMTTDPGDLVFDPTCGSGTTAYVAEQWGRRWITIDTSRIALNIAKTRLMTATFPWYKLYDEQGQDIRQGFIYKKLPHITLKSLANDELPEEETLYDQPEVDRKKLRVSGPFTVETLQNFEPLPPEELDCAAPQAESLERFEARVFEHLKSAGVKNGIRNENAVFTRINRLASSYLHAEGFYESASGERKAYIHVGPKYGTVIKQAVNEAIKECREKGDADWLIILGFAFESDITNQTATTKLGSFEITKVRMHDDLLQEGLLKRDKKAASFVTIGEPDIRLHVENGEAVVEVCGLDIYDPIRDEVKPRSVADIAYWMVDDDYDRSNFVVRQVFFCGGDKDEFDKWKKGLSDLAKKSTKRKAERTLKIALDDEAFERLYAFKSHPILATAGRRIAVRVISQFGEESTKVLTIPC